MTNTDVCGDMGQRLPSSGFRLGRYELIFRLGSGGSGQVYLARTTGTKNYGRLVVIKILHPHLGGYAHTAQSLMHEATIAYSIRHRNTVTALELEYHNDMPFLVMEYIEGGSLAELCDGNPRFRPMRLLGPIMLDALHGLRAAHELQDASGQPVGLVHRDFSSPNLLVGTDGNCRVTDFGIARTDTLSDLTTVGGAQGKPQYMAPEQVANEQLDQRTDLFAAGVVLWNAITGKRLFDGPCTAATLYNVLWRDIPKPSEIGLKPDPVFDPIILKALARNPEERFQTAGEMAEALREVLSRARMMGTTREVGAWVTETFRSRLITQRKYLRSYEGMTARRGRCRSSFSRWGIVKNIYDYTRLLTPSG